MRSKIKLINVEHIRYNTEVSSLFSRSVRKFGKRRKALVHISQGKQETRVANETTCISNDTAQHYPKIYTILLTARIMV